MPNAAAPRAEISPQSNIDFSPFTILSPFSVVQRYYTNYSEKLDKLHLNMPKIATNMSKYTNNMQ
ncbi:hypothetical protein GCM10008982_23710 [Anoxybacillus voinovskiensis]|nr:hypothetical protein GCM10008982_23710 [Anoxybacillus voinovskiensis]